MNLIHEFGIKSDMPSGATNGANWNISELKGNCNGKKI